MNITPASVFEEYENAQRKKAAVGSNGISQQSKINEKFHASDQWYSSSGANERPLVRHNIIKRIGDYKMSTLLGGDININFSAEGVPNTLGIIRNAAALRKKIAENAKFEFSGDTTDEEISFVMSALNNYQRTTAQRLGFNNLAERALKNSFTSGTGILYTYWDDTINTGLYADDFKNVPIKGDIACECLSVDNICFADDTLEDVQKQPYIIISAQREVNDVIREISKYNPSALELFDTDSTDKVTVLTKLFKVYEGDEVKVMAVRVAEGITVRNRWDTGIRRYPISVFCWERRQNSAYGDSEITYLIPNQIAINRMITARVWSVLSGGMPTMVVNGDVIDGEITNDPGQIIKVFGSNEDVMNAIHYVSPPDSSDAYSGIIEPLINNTLSNSGANAAALGDVNPDNTSAIIQLRNAAKLPLALMKNRYYDFLEETARIWAEFWICAYGNRRIKISDNNGTWYMNFKSERYKDLIINTSVQATADDGDYSNTLAVLDKLLDKGIITARQYISRLPKGVMPDSYQLLNELKEENVNDGQ